jgi:heme-degrading monooxygenase HmoA
MLIKWIKCEVDPYNKALFSKAQEQWKELKNVSGFLGQVGGWNVHNPFEAGILVFWEDDNAYQTFMKNEHDEIFMKSNQANTYQNITVTIYKKMFDISHVEISKCLKKGGILFVAECYIGHEKQLHFEQIQEEWNKGMSDSKGMLGCYFGKFQKNNEKYLVASFWEDTSLRGYDENKFSSIIEVLQTIFSTKMVTGSLIELNKNWTVF